MCARTADPADLLAVAAAILSEPLDTAQPRWTLTLLDLLTEGRSALVWSSHHAMADGPSVLRAVRAIVSDGPECALEQPEPVPGWTRLTREAWLGRVTALRGGARLRCDRQ